jgi:hypothetical protein
MLAKALVIAMAADIARSDYAKPTLIRSRSREWLIACRWGPEGEYLSIATAGPITEPLALVAPQVIAPIHSLVGVLVSESESQSTSTFLLVRQLPGAIELAGTFFPGRWLRAAAGPRRYPSRLQGALLAQLRLARRQGDPQGHSRSGPLFGRGNVLAISKATRRDWIGEFMPQQQAAERLAIRATGDEPSAHASIQAASRRPGLPAETILARKLPPFKDRRVTSP